MHVMRYVGNQYYCFAWFEHNHRILSDRDVTARSSITLDANPAYDMRLKITSTDSHHDDPCLAIATYCKSRCAQSHTAISKSVLLKQGPIYSLLRHRDILCLFPFSPLVLSSIDAIRIQCRDRFMVTV